MEHLESYDNFMNEKKPAGAPEFHHSDAPDAEGRFRDLSPKDLAAWLIKTRKKDLKKISGSLTQQVVFNRNEDPEYADKMERTRKEVYKQLGREDLLKESIDMAINEAKSITLITYGGRETQYTNAEIEEFLNDLDLSAEDLPGMIYRASMSNSKLIGTRAKSFKKKKEAIEELLKKIKDHKGDVVIDIDSKKSPMQHNIIFESLNERILLIMKDVVSRMVSDGFGYRTSPKMKEELKAAIKDAITPILKKYDFAVQEADAKPGPDAYMTGLDKE